MTNHYIYFIKENKTRRREFCAVKIGVSSNPEKRLTAMQTGNPRKLSIEVKMGPFSRKEAYGMEKKLHRNFKKFGLK